jgi:hypothetical protein
MPRLKKDEQTPEQIASLNRYHRLYKLAEEAGFDDDAFVYTEFCLMPFFELVVEQCAKIAEKQSRVYTGEHNEGKGATDASIAIRAFGKGISYE